MRDRDTASQFMAAMHDMLLTEAARAEIAEPRDLLRYDATVDACVRYGALYGLTVEQTLLMLAVRLAAEKREVQKYAMTLLERQPITIAIPGRQQ